jgi:hypothetical protein
MNTMADLVGAYTSDVAKVAGDNQAIAAAQAALAPDEAQESTDEATLASAIVTTGPFAVVSSDGTQVSVYTAASASPGFDARPDADAGPDPQLVTAPAHALALLDRSVSG